MAVNADNANRAFATTLGFALEFSARSLDDSLKRKALLGEAKRIFENVLEKEPSDPYSYLGLFQILKQSIEQAEGTEKRELQATALSLLTEAWDETNESEKIAGELAKLRKQLGTLEDGIEIAQAALTRKTSDVRLRDLLIRFLFEKKEYQQALTVARDGAKLDPTAWRLQRWLARIRQHVPGELNISAIKGNYEAAIRHHKGDVALMVEFAAFLFKQLQLDDAKVEFQKVKSLTIAAQEKRRVRSTWRDQDEIPRAFTGKVQALRGPRGTVLAVPENFEASFWLGSLGSRSLRDGELVRFTVNFTANGPEARILNVRIPRGF
jgi:tetratricopeptide (TPR) repeat protein